MCRCRANINIAPGAYSARSTTCVPRLFVIAIPRAARPAIGRRSTPAPAQCTHRSLGVADTVGHGVETRRGHEFDPCVDGVDRRFVVGRGAKDAHHGASETYHS